MNGLLDDCQIRFRNCCDKNESLSKIPGLLDYWMNRLKSAQKMHAVRIDRIIGLLDEYQSSVII